MAHLSLATLTSLYQRACADADETRRLFEIKRGRLIQALYIHEMGGSVDIVTYREQFDAAHDALVPPVDWMAYYGCLILDAMRAAGLPPSDGVFTPEQNRQN